MRHINAFQQTHMDLPSPIFLSKPTVYDAEVQTNAALKQLYLPAASLIMDSNISSDAVQRSKTKTPEGSSPSADQGNKSSAPPNPRTFENFSMPRRRPRALQPGQSSSQTASTRPSAGPSSAASNNTPTSTYESFPRLMEEEGGSDFEGKQQENDKDKGKSSKPLKRRLTAAQESLQRIVSHRSTATTAATARSRSSSLSERIMGWFSPRGADFPSDEGAGADNGRSKKSSGT